MEIQLVKQELPVCPPRKLKPGWTILPGTYVYNKSKRQLKNYPQDGQIVYFGIGKKRCKGRIFRYADKVFAIVNDWCRCEIEKHGKYIYSTNVIATSPESFKMLYNDMMVDVTKEELDEILNQNKLND